MPRYSDIFLVLPLLCCLQDTRAGEDRLASEAADSLKRASRFFREHVAREGGYLWHYDHELTKGEGEGKVGPTTVWIEPPGTPAVGLVWLDAYRATGDRYYLEAARSVGECLVKGQLRSGGWDYRIELAPQDRLRYSYRVDPLPKDRSKKLFNRSTLDDAATQSSMRLLMRLDAALDFADGEIHQASTYALACLIKAQYPNGAWPQRFDDFPDPAAHPVKKAAYPDSWPRKCPPGSESRYFGYYTFNDRVSNNMIDVMFEAADVYGNQDYEASARRGGDFIILAQMPEPQPGWAQQYDFEMHPAWGRKWEAASIAGGESQEVLETLLRVFIATGDRKYLEPIPRAVEWLRRSRLADGTFARFYEMKTNRALYTNARNELSYINDDLPKMRYKWHPAMARYGWPSDHVDRIEREYRRLGALSPQELEEERRRTAKPPADLVGRVKAAVANLDDQGRWIEESQLRYHGPDDPTRQIIRTATFIKNVGYLGAYLGADDR